MDGRGPGLGIQVEAEARDVGPQVVRWNLEISTHRRGLDQFLADHSEAGKAKGESLLLDAFLSAIDTREEKEVAVTIYNENLALIKDKRAITLPKGESTLAFREVSGRMRPMLVPDGIMRIRVPCFCFSALAIPDACAKPELPKS